jgi:hypothetical protein
MTLWVLLVLPPTSAVIFEMAEKAVIVQGTTVIVTELLLCVFTGLAGILTVIDFVSLT